MSQSTVSPHLQMMLKVGLLDAERIGQRTYYRRNEQAVDEPADYQNRPVVDPVVGADQNRGPTGSMNIDK